MLIPAMVAYKYHNELIVGPAFIIFLAVTTILMLKYRSLRPWLSLSLMFAGIVEFFSSLVVVSIWGLQVGLVTLLSGGMAYLISRQLHVRIQSDSRKLHALKRTTYILLAVLVVSSAFVISLRATKALREDWLETSPGISDVNLTVKGTITEIRLNYERGNGYSYHVFPAYIIMDNLEFVWASEEWGNPTNADEFLKEGPLIIGYDKLDVAGLAVGQTIEARGWVGFLEDSVYSGLLIVAPSMEESYVKPL